MSAADPLPAIEGYTIEQVIGRGRRGWVYRARQHGLERTVAVKILDPDLAVEPAERERFLREARAAARLHHPHIVRLHAFGTDPASGLHFLTLDFVNGISLAEAVKRNHRFSEPRACAVGQCVAHALACAEAAGFVHRELTSRTILLDETGTPIVTGLSLAKHLHDPPLTQRGRVLGTPPYMSPEQRREEPLDGRSDQYALGLVICELLIGRPRLDLDELAGVTSPATLAVIQRLCAERREERFPTTAEAVEAIDALMTGHTLLRLPPAPTEHSLRAFLLPDSAGGEPGPELRVRVLRGDERLTELRTHAEVVSLGRGASNLVRIDDTTVSRRHAELHWHGSALWLVPVSTTNPTRLNGVAVEGPRSLQPGEVIGLADTVQVQLDWGAPDASEAAAPLEDDETFLAALEQEGPTGATLDLAPRGAPAARESMQGWIVVEASGRTLRVEGLFQAGSSPCCDLRLPSPQPRKALVIARQDDRFHLLNVAEDALCVRLNGEPLTDEALLEEGDTVSVGELRLRFTTFTPGYGGPDPEQADA